MAMAHEEAAATMEAEVAAARTDPRCTFDHSKMSGSQCLACGARKVKA
jgi:hypothetical protein